jgi:hypothetical protein
MVKSLSNMETKAILLVIQDVMRLSEFLLF